VHHAQRRDDIADAVLAVVAERGLAAVSLTEVAAQAGVSPGRVQHYFPTKDKLIAAAFERGNALSSARIDTELGTLEAPPRRVLTVVLCHLIPEDPATWAHMRVRQFFTSLALVDEAIADRLRRDYDRFHQQMADLVQRDQDRGVIAAAVNAQDVATALVALAEGLAYYVLTGVTSATTARERVLAALADLYSNSVAA
jgi:AcrR family transcriptional regulator